ncbi:MAG: hypothetical protein HKM87_09960 [Ignavibacteriaceae bacterium]|nr:hypothetical protein [Ignavibacteriaceae bacterium]
MKKNNIGYFIIASAIIWGAVIIGCAIILKGTPYKDDVAYILYSGTIIHLIFIWGTLATQIKKSKGDQNNE